MPQEIDPLRRTSFDHMAEQYDAARPAYPAVVIDDVLARSGAKRAVEVGAGTGKATVMFGERGLDIVAIEPGGRLAALLRERVHGLAVSVVESMFEACQLSGFDLVYSAQAFHWIEPSIRYLKAAAVLRPGGALALLMNEKSPMDPPIRADFDAAYARWLGWPPWNDTYLAECEGRWTSEIVASGLFGPVHVGRFPWTATYTSQQYIDLIDTYSDHATQPDDKRVPLYDDIRVAIDKRGGTLEIPYTTLEFFALRL